VKKSAIMSPVGRSIFWRQAYAVNDFVIYQDNQSAILSERMSVHPAASGRVVSLYSS
jgi:hypothetical protein